MRARQGELFGKKPRTKHGGELSRGKRKVLRPLDPRAPIHLTLRSSRARGALSMLTPRNRALVNRILENSAKRHEIRVYRFVNVGNHLHLIVKAPSRRAFQNFLRQLAGHVAQAILGALKGAPRGKFWDGLAYTRIVSHGRDFVNLQRYLLKNLAEALGLKPGRTGIGELALPRTGPPLHEIWGEIRRGQNG